MRCELLDMRGRRRDVICKRSTCSQHQPTVLNQSVEQQNIIIFLQLTIHFGRKSFVI